MFFSQLSLFSSLGTDCFPFSKGKGDVHHYACMITSQVGAFASVLCCAMTRPSSKSAKRIGNTNTGPLSVTYVASSTGPGCCVACPRNEGEEPFSSPPWMQFESAVQTPWCVLASDMSPSTGSFWDGHEACDFDTGSSSPVRKFRPKRSWFSRKCEVGLIRQRASLTATEGEDKLAKTFFFCSKSRLPVAVHRWPEGCPWAPSLSWDQTDPCCPTLPAEASQRRAVSSRIARYLLRRVDIKKVIDRTCSSIISPSCLCFVWHINALKWLTEQPLPPPYNFVTVVFSAMQMYGADDARWWHSCKSLHIFFGCGVIPVATLCLALIYCILIKTDLVFWQVILKPWKSQSHTIESSKCCLAIFLLTLPII